MNQVRARDGLHGLLVAALSTGCAGYLGGMDFQSQSLQSVGDVSPISASEPSRTAARRQAAVDFHCDGDSLTVREVRPESDEAFRVEGCGRRGVFVAVWAGGVVRALPLLSIHEQTRVLLRRYVQVDADPGPSLARLQRDASALGMTDYGAPVTVTLRNESALRDWTDLANAAVRELSCTVDALRLDVVRHMRAPSTFLAEGCGARAQFVRNSDDALVAVSRVATAP
jgi:hypothetical protein